MQCAYCIFWCLILVFNVKVFEIHPFHLEMGRVSFCRLAFVYYLDSSFNVQ